jgi:hypothetical protein
MLLDLPQCTGWPYNNPAQRGKGVEVEKTLECTVTGQEKRKGTDAFLNNKTSQSPLTH